MCSPLCTPCILYASMQCMVLTISTHYLRKEWCSPIMLTNCAMNGAHPVCSPVYAPLFLLTMYAHHLEQMVIMIIMIVIMIKIVHRGWGWCRPFLESSCAHLLEPDLVWTTSVGEPNQLLPSIIQLITGWGRCRPYLESSWAHLLVPDLPPHQATFSAGFMPTTHPGGPELIWWMGSQSHLQQLFPCEFAVVAVTTGRVRVLWKALSQGWFGWDVRYPSTVGPRSLQILNSYWAKSRKYLE